MRGKTTALFALALLVGGLVWAQTTTAPGIDVEIYDPTDGDNGFCVSPGDTFTARVRIRPGDDTTTTCTQACGTVQGGSGRLATMVVDVQFDTSKLTFISAQNMDYPDALLQDNTASGRIGVALAGDWTPDADTSGTLANPCDMAKVTTAMDIMEVSFGVPSGFSGSTKLHIRRQADGFALSAADACANGFDESNGFDEIVDAIVGEDFTPDQAASGQTCTATEIPKVTGTSDFTVTVNDGTNPKPGHVVDFEITDPINTGTTMGSVTDNGDGTYSATLQAGSKAGRVKVRYRVDRCSGSWYDSSDEDKVIMILNPAYSCKPGDANDSGGTLSSADFTAIMLEWLDGDTNDDPSAWPSQGSYSATSCADANDNGSLSTGDATAVMTMWLAGL